MAEKYFPFRSVSGDRKYSAEDWAAYFALFLSNGVFYSSVDKLKVVASEGMKVKVGKGAAFIAGRMYMMETDKIITLDTADGALNRIDRIVLRCDYTSRKITVEVVKGSYSEKPTAQGLNRNSDIYELALADVYVAAGVISITQSNITDQRLNTSLCGIVTGLVDQADTEDVFNQFTAYLEEFKQASQAEFEGKKEEWEEEFNLWFREMKAVLEDEEAVKLKNKIEEIKDGTTQVGNAKTLDGHEAEYFLPKSGGNITGNVDIDAILAVGNVTKEAKYQMLLRNAKRNLSSEIDANGNYAFWDSTHSDYIFQSTKEGKNTFHGVASECLPITGGMASEQIGVEKADATEAKVVARNALGTIELIVSAGGRMGLYDRKNGAWLCDSMPNGTATFNGTATENLPLTGGTISNKLDTPLVLNNATGGAVTAFLGYKADGAVLGYIGFKNGIPYVTYPDNFGYILHTGNYANYAADVENGTFDLKMDNVALGTGTYYKVGKMVYCRASGKLPQKFENVNGYKVLTGLPFANASCNQSVADFHTHEYYSRQNANRVFTIYESEIYVDFSTPADSGQPFMFSIIYFTE